MTLVTKPLRETVCVAFIRYSALTEFGTMRFSGLVESVTSRARVVQCVRRHGRDKPSRVGDNEVDPVSPVPNDTGALGSAVGYLTAT